MRPIPAEPERLMELGRAREEAGDGLRAEQYYEVALALGAEPAVVYPRLIAVCLAGGRLSSALVHVGHALEESPNEEHLTSLRDALEQALGARGADEPPRARVTKPGEDIDEQLVAGEPPAP